MSALRIKVVYDKAQLVVPVSSSTEKVFHLVQVINNRLQGYLGDNTVRVKELCTNDGFYINPNDSVAEVIQNNDVLEAKSYVAWLKDNIGLLEKAAHSVCRLDYAAYPNQYYSVEVGRHKHNKLYIKIHTFKGEVHRLELFDEESLQTFGKDGKHLITRYQGKEKEEVDWFAEAYFIVEKDVVTGLEVQIKATSDKRPEIVYFPIQAVGLTVGEPKVIQTASLPRPSKVYEVPKSIREGPSFDPKNYVSAEKEPSGVSKEDLELSEEVVGTGNSGLEIKQKDPILADQSWYSESEKGFDNMFLNHLSLFNPTDKQIAVVKVTSEYERDGAWHATKIRLGEKSGYYRYSTYGPDADEGFNMESNQRMNLAVVSTIFINAPNYDKNRRAHGSLPNPLRLKITFFTKDGTKSEIITEYKNKPLYLATREGKEAAKGQQAIFWTQVDDIAAEARIYGTVFRVKGKDEDGERLEIETANSNRHLWLNKKSLQEYIYKATTSGKSELLLDGCSLADAKVGHSTKVYGLVDVENQWFYGLRFELTTNTSSAVETFILPNDW